MNRMMESEAPAFRAVDDTGLLVFPSAPAANPPAGPPFLRLGNVPAAPTSRARMAVRPRPVVRPPAAVEPPMSPVVPVPVSASPPLSTADSTSSTRSPTKPRTVAQDHKDRPWLQFSGPVRSRSSASVRNRLIFAQCDYCSRSHRRCSTKSGSLKCDGCDGPAHQKCVWSNINRRGELKRTSPIFACDRPATY